LVLPDEECTVPFTEELLILVLTRKAGEKIRIGNDIVVTVLAVEGYRVRVGIAAPADVPILRAELTLRVGENSVLPFGTQAKAAE
jgi:carbon storage regulator